MPDENNEDGQTTGRLTGISPQGLPVNNVTPDNMYDVNERNPWVETHLYDHDVLNVKHVVFIPNTREDPDVVKFDGILYDVVSTFNVPYRYKESMVSEAVKNVPNKYGEEK